MLPFELTKDTPYLALSGELWSVFCEYFNRNWPCYKGFLLYIYIYHEISSNIFKWRQGNKEFSMTESNAPYYCYIQHLSVPLYRKVSLRQSITIHTGRFHYNAINYFQNPHDKTAPGLPMRTRYGVSFVSAISEWCSASVTTVLYQYRVILDCVIRAPHCIKYNVTTHNRACCLVRHYLDHNPNA